mgnify:CR=1 FL=1
MSTYLFVSTETRYKGNPHTNFAVKDMHVWPNTLSHFILTHKDLVVLFWKEITKNEYESLLETEITTN